MNLMLGYFSYLQKQLTERLCHWSQTHRNTFSFITSFKTMDLLTTGDNFQEIFQFSGFFFASFRKFSGFQNLSSCWLTTLLYSSLLCMAYNYWDYIIYRDTLFTIQYVLNYRFIMCFVILQQAMVSLLNNFVFLI